MILVSVIVVTYNHESYIRQALQSIVEQKVNFNYEIIVANDASTDNTLAIVREFEEKYPEIFVIQNNEKNIGILNNVIKVTNLIQGKYFAILDGDDFWTYAHKLQYQVDFLEKNTEYNGVFHDSKIVAEDTNAEQKLFFNKKLYSQSYFYKEKIHPVDILNRLILPSSSAVFRTNKDYQKNPALLDDFSVMWKMSCLLIKNSKFYFISEPWSTYRNHSNGISKSRNEDFHLSHIKFLKTLTVDEFFKAYKYDIYNSISKEYMVLLSSKITVNKKNIFIYFLMNEVRKTWYYRKKIF